MGTPIEGGGVQGGDPNEGNAPGLNPAWNDVLSVIPEQYHNHVTPHFQQWDQQAQQRIEQANSKLKEFEPYEEFVKNGFTPEDLEQGVRILYEINQNPQAVYEALGSAYGLTPQQAANVVEQAQKENEGQGQNEPGQAQQYNDPRVDKLQQGVELVSQIILDEHNQKLQDAADRELEKELSDLKKNHGEYNERYVLAMMQNGMSGEEAVKSWQEEIGSHQPNPRPFAPKVMGNATGGGSGLPSQAIDPTKLSGKDTRALVAEMLAKAAAEQ